MDSGQLHNSSVIFYEIIPTQVTKVAQRAAVSAGFAVSARTGSRALEGISGIVVAHCATYAWGELATLAPAGTICLHVSSVRRESVPRPQRTSRLALLLELVPAVSEISESGWMDLFSRLSAPDTVDLLIQQPMKSPWAQLFTTPKIPVALCSLLVLAQAFLAAPVERKAEMTMRTFWLNAFEGLCTPKDVSISAALKRNVVSEIMDIDGQSDLSTLDGFTSELDCPGYYLRNEHAASVASAIVQLLYPESRSLCCEMTKESREWTPDIIERDLIVWALHKVECSQIRAARLLGISRGMLRRRMAKYSIGNSRPT